MIKNIKRVGIITLIISVICCLSFALSFSFVATKNASIEQSSKTANYEQTLNETDFDAEIILKSDTNGTIADKWNNAINLSKTEGREVKVQLAQNWIASYDSSTGISTFNTGDSPELSIPADANIKLDLAGFRIDRNQMKYNPQVGGNVINVLGTLTIVDTSYDSDVFDELYDRYKTNKDSYVARINSIATGKITGGNLIGSGAGIYVQASGTLNIYGGKIIDNNSSMSGAGIYCVGNLNFYDGMVCGNKLTTSSGHGAGISVKGGLFNMFGGYIVNNSGEFYGGGIDIRNDKNANLETSLSNCVIAHNTSHYGGGISLNYLAIGNFQNVDISYNVNLGNSAGVALWDGGEATFNNCKITYNQAYRGRYGDTNGGAGITSNGRTELYNTEITDNCFWNGLDTNVAYGAGIYYSGSAPLVLDNVLLTRNVIKSDINDGTNALGGGIYTRADIKISGNVQIFDNIAHGVASDLYLQNAIKIVVPSSLENETGISKIGIKFAQGYSDTTFTTGYTTNNSGVNPNKYFFNDDGAYMAIVSENELRFEKTIESGKYDFVYLENDLRKTYTETGFVHTQNDFDKSQLVNDKKIVLGKISPNTSVNEFIGNLNFASNMLKLYNNDNLIYNKGEQTQYTTLYDNGLELAVGTGWKLEVYASSGDKIEDIYLSVLGDITGDGRVNSADCNYLRKIVNNNEFSRLTAEQKLSALIVNRGRTPNNTDIQIIWEVVCGRVDINDFI